VDQRGSCGRRIAEARWDDSFTLQIGVLFPDVTDDGPRAIKTLRTTECHANIRVLSAPLDDALNWDHDMTITDRRA
jgi:hypothetical protein